MRNRNSKWPLIDENIIGASKMGNEYGAMIFPRFISFIVVALDFLWYPFFIALPKVIVLPTIAMAIIVTRAVDQVYYSSRNIDKKNNLIAP